MANVTLARGGRERRGELQAWYLGKLRPKVADAARAGAIPPAAAAALDQEMRGLLDLPLAAGSAEAA